MGIWGVVFGGGFVVVGVGCPSMTSFGCFSMAGYMCFGRGCFGDFGWHGVVEVGFGSFDCSLQRKLVLVSLKQTGFQLDNPCLNAAPNTTHIGLLAHYSAPHSSWQIDFEGSLFDDVDLLIELEDLSSHPLLAHPESSSVLAFGFPNGYC